jgi:hypothetical protein
MKLVWQLPAAFAAEQRAIVGELRSPRQLVLINNRSVVGKAHLREMTSVK